MLSKVFWTIKCFIFYLFLSNLTLRAKPFFSIMNSKKIQISSKPFLMSCFKHGVTYRLIKTLLSAVLWAVYMWKIDFWKFPNCVKSKKVMQRTKWPSNGLKWVFNTIISKVILVKITVGSFHV